MKVIREWKTMLIPYEQAVEELKVKFKAIRNQYRELNEYSPIEFVTGRVKKISSIIEKAERRNIALENIEEEMEDIAGLRLMCQFIDDIYEVVNLIYERSGKDFTVLYEKDYIKSPKESGYKSYHIIIKYPVQTALGTKEILVEFQIRTLAMNFWAIIEHSLSYKYKTQMPDEIRERLKNSALAATRLDEEMTEISKEVRNAQLMFEERSNTVRDIITNIQLLFSQGKETEAMDFQKRFDSIKNEDNMFEFELLLSEIKHELPRFNLFEKGNLI
ncbi:MAG: GTP pyrophosphokinase family protein [Clostridiales bacterium]|nr:GTP pyrophosphokinase family protein [Clostridiales bacterium]